MFKSAVPTKGSSTVMRSRFWICSALLFELAIGCSKRGPVAPAPLPKLNGPRIAFTSNRSGSLGIHLYDPATAQIVRLSPGGTFDQEPAISPDGTRIAFVSPSPTGLQLLTMAVNGSDRRAVSADPGFDCSWPRWSPDSRSIVLTRTSRSTGEHDVFTILASGDSLRRITNDSLSTSLAWSPDGSRILLVHQPVDPNVLGSFLRDVLPNGDSLRTIGGPFGYRILGADYSPDGLRIALSTYSDFGFGYSVVIRSLDGADGTGVTLDNPPMDGLSAPSWSPDGTLIAFSARVISGTTPETDDLFTVGSTPTNPQPLMSGPSSDSQPNWGPKP